MYIAWNIYYSAFRSEYLTLRIVVKLSRHLKSKIIDSFRFLKSKTCRSQTKQRSYNIDWTKPKTHRSDPICTYLSDSMKLAFSNLLVHCFQLIQITSKIKYHCHLHVLWHWHRTPQYSIRRKVFFFFSIQLLSVLRGHSVFASSPQWPMTSDFEGFSIPDFIHYIFFLS